MELTAHLAVKVEHCGLQYLHSEPRKYNFSNISNCSAVLQYCITYSIEAGAAVDLWGPKGTRKAKRANFTNILLAIGAHKLSHASCHSPPLLASKKPRLMRTSSIALFPSVRGKKAVV